MPEWLFYEVDPDADCVLRSVEVFPDGRKERNNLALESRDRFVCVSLCHGPFMELVTEADLQVISMSEFEALYESSADKPFE